MVGFVSTLRPALDSDLICQGAFTHSHRLCWSREHVQSGGRCWSHICYAHSQTADRRGPESRRHLKHTEGRILQFNPRCPCGICSRLDSPVLRICNCCSRRTLVSCPYILFGGPFNRYAASRGNLHILDSVNRLLTRGIYIARGTHSPRFWFGFILYRELSHQTKLELAHSDSQAFQRACHEES